MAEGGSSGLDAKGRAELLISNSKYNCFISVEAGVECSLVMGKEGNKGVDGILRAH